MTDSMSEFVVRDRGSALEGFAALYDGTGNSGATVFEVITTRCTVDYELVDLCQQCAGGVSHGEPLGKLLSLWPHDMLKRALVSHAEEFVRQVAKHGFSALSGVYAFRLWGPYMEKLTPTLRTWTPEEGNHLIPNHLKRKAVSVQGYRGDEFNFNKGAAFLIQGSFTRLANLGHVSEENGVLWV